MEQGSETRRESAARTSSGSEQAGCYVYCVARAGEQGSLGAIGIEGHETYTVPHKGLCAVIHDCPARPYESTDPEVAGVWVLAHHRVVEAAWKRWGNVLPLTFNTIIAATEKSSEENLVAWLETEYDSLNGRFDTLAGKSEYVVQVSWDAEVITGTVAKASPEIRKLEEEIGSKPRGLAYMYRQKLGKLLKKEIEAKAEKEFKALYDTISRCVDNIHVEKTKEDQEGRQMLMNLSCLVSTERYPDMEAELAKLGNTEGYFVRLAGPLPPYSFC